MAFGLGVLRLAPDAFWRLTPREVAAAAGLLRPRPPAATRGDLDRLLAAHPDPA